MRSKTSLLVVMALALFFTLASTAYSADEALTPEKISGIWEGKHNYVLEGSQVSDRCRVLFTPSLNGIINCNSQWDRYGFVFDGKGDIVNNQMIIRDREKPNMIRLKAYITSKNQLEGEVEIIRSGSPKGDLLRFKKIRELTDEQKQLPLAQLDGLLK